MKISRYTYHKIKRNLNIARHIVMDLLLVEIIVIIGICIAGMMI